ncbi:MAG: hypothetical protein JW996_05270 [Candidatus Cloacimonetes bacterium]|nr:hypothetical protein [Candidatus Cloacimonadota bacterium]
MKTGIIIQIIIAIFILSAWNLLHLVYQQQHNYYYRELSSVPIIYFIPQRSTVDSLAEKLRKYPYLRRLETEVDSLINARLIEAYNLEYARDILKDFSLPNVIKMYVDAGKFLAPEKSELEEMLAEDYPEIIMNYNDENWYSTQNKIEFLNKIYHAVNILAIVLCLLILILLRIHFESRRNEFWRIYKLSGGEMGLRRKQFITTSLILIILPFLIVFALFQTAYYLHYVRYFVDLRIWGIEFIVLIFTALISAVIQENKI